MKGAVFAENAGRGGATKISLGQIECLGGVGRQLAVTQLKQRHACNGARLRNNGSRMRSRIFVLAAAIGFLFGQSAFGVTQLVTNGGFESGSAGWQFQGSLVNVPVFTNPNLANRGTNFLSMGNQNGAVPAVQQGVFQTVTIPTNTLLAQYSFYWNVLSSVDPADSVQFTAFITDTNNNPLYNLGMVSNPSNGTNGYQQVTINVTNLAGQTVRLFYEVDAGVTGIGIRTSFDIDDVSLLAFSAADIPANDYFTNSATLHTTTSITVFATNLLATVEPGEPKHAGRTGGHSLWWNWTAPSNGVVTITTAGSTFDTLLGIYTGDSVSNLTQVAANDDVSGGRTLTSSVQFTVAAGTEYQIAVDGKNGATGVVELNLSFKPDTKGPSVTITTPKSGARLTNSTVMIQGTASDNLAVALVQFRLENADGTNDYQDADGTNNWSGTVTNLVPGPNTIRVRAFDTSSNAAVVTRAVTFVVVSPLTLTVSGSGTVTPNLNNQFLNVGANYTVTAKPGVGQVFSNWTDVDSVQIATTAALTFTMQSNMVLQANFVPNPFIPVAGTYQGLFYDTNGVAHQSSGFFNVTVTSSGSYTAKIMLAGKSASLTGQFSAGGMASNNIIAKGAAPVPVQLQLDLGGGGITGLLTGSNWTAELSAPRAVTSAGDQAGHYTLLIPGAEDGVGHPGGDSYSTATIAATGGITFAGAMADGTTISGKANLLANGQCAFYVSLYSGNGSALGWLTFSNGDVTGGVDWFKLAAAGGKFYPAGFTNEADVMGSAYKFSNSVPVLNVSTGEVWLANGNVSPAFTNQVALSAASKVTNLSSNKLTLTITTTSGLFKGSVVNPANGKTITINGVVLQNQNFGGGFFLGTNQTGRVFFGP
jgi:hypothetical protein